MDIHRFAYRNRWVSISAPSAQHLETCYRFRMSTLRSRAFVFVWLILMSLHAHGRSPINVAARAPLWGDLAAGPYSVGFRSIFRFDASRTWRETRDYAGNFVADPHGRPVQLNVWYPAMAEADLKPMTFRNYVDQTAPPELAQLNELMSARNWHSAHSAVPAEQLSAMLSIPMRASAQGRAVRQSFPLVLYVGGLNAEINSNAVLAELLASHGYVVASVSLIGATNERSAQGRSAADFEATVRDMEFALATLKESSNADVTRLAVVGHSLGAIDALIFALRNSNVKAAIGLDGTYGFRGSAQLLTDSYGYDPRRMRASVLDLRRAQGEQSADVDLTPLLSFRYAGRTLINMTNMHHSDFTSFAMIADAFQVPIRSEYVNTGWARATAARGYEHTCRIVLAFLNENVKREAGGSEEFQRTIERVQGINLRHLTADPVPPSPRECAAMGSTSSLDQIKALFEKGCRDQPMSACVDADSFNSYGYDLLGQQRGRDALLLFEIVAWAHPGSANAQDSLADGYLAIGDKHRAREAIREAIELVPTDNAISESSKAAFLAEENRRLGSIEQE
jgi:dienelactone hydrolase